MNLLYFSFRIVHGSDLNSAPFGQVFQALQVGRNLGVAEVDDDQRARVALLDPRVAEELVAVGCSVDELGRAEQDGFVLPQVGLK